MTNLAVVLHRWRINEGRTLRQVSAQIGVAASTWMRMEHGYGLDGATLVKLLAWFMRPALPPARQASTPPRVSWDGITLPKQRGREG